MTEVLTVAVPFPVIGVPGYHKVWGIVCPEHPTWPEGINALTDTNRDSAEAFARACACAHPGHKRKRTYSTANESGMEFISNRWVFVGDKGYRVRANGDGTFRVVSYNVLGDRPIYARTDLTEDDAHVLAARLAGAVPHPVREV